MKRIAVFGNAGGGKSRLSRELAAALGLPLHVLDIMQFRPGGAPVPREEFLAAHQAAMSEDGWVFDGFGGHDTLWPRLEAADTLVHVDLPIARHAFWVTKRFVNGWFSPPPGWPEGSPLVSSTLSSYRVLWGCHKHLTPRYREFVAKHAGTKRVFHVRSTSELGDCLESARLARR